MVVYAAALKTPARQQLKSLCSVRALLIIFFWKQLGSRILVSHPSINNGGIILTFSFAGPIAAIFWHNEEFAMGLGRDIGLDGVVCVVDAVFGQQVFFFISARLVAPR